MLVNTPISIGELIDKISILSITRNKYTNEVAELKNKQNLNTISINK